MHTSPDVAYVRTTAGQSACLSDLPLPWHSKRLLLLVNGFTPIGHLFERMELDEPEPALDALVSSGLIAPVHRTAGHRH